MKWTKIPGNELDTIIAHDRQKRVRIAYSKSIVTLFLLWNLIENNQATNRLAGHRVNASI